MGEDSRRGNKMLSLGSRPAYPITITKLYKSTGDRIKKQEPMFQYSFKIWGEEGNRETGEYEPVLKTTFTEWPCPADGKLLKWHIRAGEVVGRDRECATVEEDCTHEIQFQGLCAMCGKDMTEANWAADKLDTERAPINMTHDQTRLLVSKKAATKTEFELQKRLLDQRKLILVVDLDQTIIHACIEPTIGDWQRDPTNPNHEAVKDVKSFQLNDDGPRGLASGCWYYIKMRPGLVDFLEKIATVYELHVYTMGTRAYAMNIAKIVDPEQKLFGNRVISRDENGSMTAKSLQRLFPVSTRMVVIIDDRADVWPRNRPNLIKVVPYDFFKGIGDINSSFLPKREDLIAPSAQPPKNVSAKGSKPAKPNGGAKAAAGKKSTLEELANMSSGEGAALIKKQTEEQEKTLEMQIKDRPLLHMQEQLDKEDGEAASKEEGGSDAASASASHSRHHLLLDDDSELAYLEQHLIQLHEAFYRAHDAEVAGAKRSADDQTDPPDVGNVLDGLKVKVLRGTRIVLSGLVPVGVDVQLSEIGLQARSFGATILKKVSKRATHLVVSSSRARTQKMAEAERIPGIKIVNQDWLINSLSQWRHLDEAPYTVGKSAAERAAIASASTPGENTDAEAPSDGETDGAARKPKKLKSVRIVVSNPSGVSKEEEGDDSDDEDEGPDDGADDLDDESDLYSATSPVEQLRDFDWDQADAEMADFLDSDDETSADGTSTAGNNSEAEDSSTLVVGRKRKLGGSTTESDDDSRLSTDNTGAKKQRVGMVRSASKLRVVRVPGDDDKENGASLPTPHGTGDEEDVALPKSSQASAVDDDDFDEDLEADLMAELEAEELESAEQEKG
ncbi:hypothetical protein RB595_007140 [Gaeumannomyces hyphopodioides]